MSWPSEVFIRILALLQRKTLIETKNRTLKCLKRHYSTVRSMKNVALLTEDGAFETVALVTCHMNFNLNNDWLLVCFGPRYQI